MGFVSLGLSGIFLSLVASVLLTIVLNVVLNLMLMPAMFVGAIVFLALTGLLTLFVA